MIDLPRTTDWRARRQTLFLYEIDRDALVSQLPPTIEAAEIRPGVGLLAVETLHYQPGHFGETTESVEMVVAIIVEPDLRIAMPVPKFSLFVTSVISSSKAFVDNERVLLHTPMEHLPAMRIEYSQDCASAIVFDGDRPIVEQLAGRSPDEIGYDPKVMWGLIFTNKDREIHRGVFRWEGEVCEHQKRGDWGKFHAHPVWRGLDVTRIRGCYRRMAAKPDLPTRIEYFHAGPR